MAVNLSKGQKVDLTKGNPGLSKLLIGLGWDLQKYDGREDFDLDASVFMTNANEKCQRDEDFIFYGNLKSSNGSVEHMGDNRTGVGEGDDELIKVDLSKVPANVSKLLVTVTIYEAVERGQNFGQVSNAYIRIVDERNGQELIRYDLSEDYSIETSVVFASIYRHQGEWKVEAVGNGFASSLREFCLKYGVNV